MTKSEAGEILLAALPKLTFEEKEAPEFLMADESENPNLKAICAVC